MSAFSLRFPLLPSQLLERLTEIPKAAKDHLKQGFTTLAQLSPQERHDTLALVVDIISTPSESLQESLVDRLSSRLKISKEQASKLYAAAALSSALNSLQQDTPPEQLVQSAIQAGIIETANEDIALTLFQALAQDRGPLNQVFQRSALADKLLPSLSDWETTVDVRLAFNKDNKVRFTVPVILLYLRTDARDQRLWFQATKPQLEQLIKDLQDTLRRAEQAEQWAKQASSSKE